jgi:short-subunit dehydrogenase
MSTQGRAETALVTGASSGIGYELAKLFAADGWDVLLVARSRDDLEAVADELTTAHDVEAHVFPQDLATPDGPRELYEAVTDAGHEVDALVNKAGFGVYGNFLETDLDAELDALTLQTHTITVLTKLFGRDMAARGDGYVLTNASVVGLVPVPSSAVYSGAKHFARAFSQAIAEELAEEGVTVTTLCPGATDTPFFERGGFDESGFGPDDRMSAATVAQRGYDGLFAGDRLVVTGRENRLFIFLRRLLPRRWHLKLAESAQRE